MRLRYKVKRIPGGYAASVFVPIVDRKGRPRMLRLNGTATYQEMRSAAARKIRAVKRRAAVSGMPLDEVGFFKSIGRFVKRATRSKALRRVFRKVKNTLKHPALQATVMAVNPALGAGLMTATQALTQADKLFSAAKSGKPGDRKRVMARAAIKIAAAKKYPAPGAAPLMLPGAAPGRGLLPASLQPQIQRQLANYLQLLLRPPVAA